MSRRFAGVGLVALALSLTACEKNDTRTANPAPAEPEPVDNAPRQPAEVARAKPALKNLQVLPVHMSKPEVKAIMKRQAKALGLTCDDCHDTDDFSVDTNEHKVTARQMMKMVAALNKDFFADEKKPVIDCFTCHQGQKKPILKK